MSAPIKAPVDRMTLTRDLWLIAETGEVGQLHELLARGADVNASNGAGVTALMIAAFHGRLEMVRALTDHGADVNLMDKDGFTAAMLAHHSDHEDIVRTLVARGAKRNPTPVAIGAASRRFETFDTFSDSDVPANGGNPAVRTLHEPPNVWDLVQETRVEFDPRSAFIGHLPPTNTIVLAVITLITVGLAVFGFTRFNALLESAPAARSVRAEQSNTMTAPAPSTVQDGTTSSLAQPRSLQATEPVKIESPAAQPVTITPVDSSLAASTVKSGTAVVARAQPDKRAAAARTRRPDQPSSITTDSTTLVTPDNQANKDKAQELTAPKVDLTLPPENEKSTDPNEVKKQEVKKDPDKAPSPSLVVPAKPSPTPQLR
jgi:hypothetical protein